MSLLSSYAVWNNKGGVGKSTITFHLATRYAELNPTKKILVIDMCPQSNISMMLLGGGSTGEDTAFNLSTSQPLPRTIVGYISQVLSAGAGAVLPQWSDFVIKPNDYNTNTPSNLFLLCGDGNLEPIAPLISERASFGALTPASNPWVWVHSLIKNLINDISSTEDDWLVLIDTNPSFSIYTEIAISSVEKLIVPINADDASRVATNAMFTLIFGTNPPHPVYGNYTYAAKADGLGVARPAIHLIIGNRLTQYEGAATAFSSISDRTAETLFNAYTQNPHRFTARTEAIRTSQDFRNQFSASLRDFNTAGVVAAHKGIPISRLRSSTYDVYGKQVTVDNRRVEECRNAIDEVVSRI